MDPLVELEVGGEVFPVVKDWDFSGLRRSPDEFQFFTIGMGASAAKKVMVEKALRAGLQPAPPLLSHHSVVRPDAVLGRGVVVHPQCFVGSGAVIGDYAVIHKAAIAQDAVVGRYATCAPHSTTGAGAEIGEGVHVGGRAAVAPGARVAAWVTVGLNGAVRGDLLESGAIYVGSPLRRLQRQG